jgi:putative membrane protein
LGKNFEQAKTARWSTVVMISVGLVVFVALLHIGFLILEMFFWTQPLGLKVFAQSLDRARSSAVLAANQGLYNGFLVAGLIWSLLYPSVEVGLQLRIFFLVCVLVAGLYGAYSVSKKILWVQAAPAALALALTFCGF